MRMGNKMSKKSLRVKLEIVMERMDWVGEVLVMEIITVVVVAKRRLITNSPRVNRYKLSMKLTPLMTYSTYDMRCNNVNYF